MKLFITSFFLTCVLMGTAQELSLNSLDSSQYFNFWEGKWIGTWDEGEGKGKATNTLSWICEGSVLQEDFQIIEGQQVGFKGTSISVFQPRSNRWRQAWADSQGGYYDFEGDFIDDKRIFKTAVIERDGNKLQQRMVFYDLEKDSFTWDWESTRDGGKTWTLNWRISYERM